MTDEPPAGRPANPPLPAAHAVPLARGLSAKLLLLTVAFVLLAEVLIFLPSVASYRMAWLKERLGTAAAVSVVLVQGDPQSLSRTAQDDVLAAMGAKAIAVRDGGISRLLVVADMPPRVDEHIDVAHTGFAEEMAGALDTLVFGGNRMLRVYGPVGDSDKEFELIMPDRRLRAAMLAYSRTVALVSLLISLFTATLVYAAIDRIMIRPALSARPPAPTRSAWRSGNCRRCRSGCTKCWSSRSIWPTSASLSPRSTTTCATSWLPRN